jgi:monoamine oxidase
MLKDVKPVQTEVEHVLVIGAGVAGMTVAQVLTKNGISCEILEGRSRIGGRIHTVSVGGVPADLGAAWVHRPTGNPLSMLLERATIQTRRFPMEGLMLGGAFYKGTKRLGRLPTLLVLMQSAFFQKFVTSANLQAFGSAQEVLDDFLSRKRFSAETADRVRALLTAFVELNRSDHLVALSPESLKLDHPYKGRDRVPIGGYSQLVSQMSSNLRIRTEAVVERVEIKSDRVVTHLQSGEALESSHIVLTVPLGVLKSEIRFDPELPTEKLSAIERMGFGRLEKAIFVFHERFWKADALLLETHDRASISFLDFTKVTGRPTLVAFLSGSSLPKNSTSSEAITETAWNALVQSFGVSSSMLKESQTSAWGFDPFSKGSYSYFAKTSSREDIRTLSSPVGERVLFAGEATNYEKTSTVDAALMSGLREGSRLLRHSKSLEQMLREL